LDEIHDSGRWGIGEEITMAKGAFGQELVNTAIGVQRCGRRRGVKQNKNKKKDYFPKERIIIVERENSKLFCI